MGVKLDVIDCGNDHECLIGLYYGIDTNSLITLTGLKRITKENKELKQIAGLDPVYASIYHSKRNYSYSDYCDKRRSVNMKRFNYCPLCGKEINWRKLRKDNERSEEN